MPDDASIMPLFSSHVAHEAGAPIVELRHVCATYNGHPALEAKVTRIHSAGPNVRLELVAQTGERLCAELSQDRYRSLNIQTGITVYVTPRDIKVFADKPE